MPHRISPENERIFGHWLAYGFEEYTFTRYKVLAYEGQIEGLRVTGTYSDPGFTPEPQHEPTHSGPTKRGQPKFVTEYEPTVSANVSRP